MTVIWRHALVGYSAEFGELAPAGALVVVGHVDPAAMGVLQAEGVVDQLDHIAVGVVDVGVVPAAVVPLPPGNLGVPRSRMGGVGDSQAVQVVDAFVPVVDCLLYTSPSPRDGLLSRMPSSA